MQNRSTEKFRANLLKLIAEGSRLAISMRYSQNKEIVAEQIEVNLGDDAGDYISKLPNFKMDYQTWYTDAKSIVRDIIPDRLRDFVSQYDRPNRKTLLPHNYTIDDYLNGLTAWEFVKTSLGFARMEQQLAILCAAEQRILHSTQDIRQMIATDLLNGGVRVARDMLRRKFTRAAAVVAGVVFEQHLIHTCYAHGVRIPKGRPSATQINNLLMGANAVDHDQYQANQDLVDLVNICSIDSAYEPLPKSVSDLIQRVSAAIKS